MFKIWDMTIVERSKSSVDNFSRVHTHDKLLQKDKKGVRKKTQLVYFLKMLQPWKYPLIQWEATSSFTMRTWHRRDKRINTKLNIMTIIIWTMQHMSLYIYYTSTYSKVKRVAIYCPNLDICERFYNQARALGIGPFIASKIGRCFLILYW
jgi:hypothetical protein